MFKQSTKKKPMATWKRGSKRWLEQRQARRKVFISNAKEVLLVVFIVLVCSVDLEPLLDMLLS